ncbi:MAG: isoprenylcysteine carboxyl methyltransferase family protein [Thermoanaerobaculia bacterium]
MVSRWLYLGLILLVVLQRSAELRLARRNERLARAAGAVEFGAGHYPWMVAIHSLFLTSCVLEVWLLGRPFAPRAAGAMLLLLGVATGLRYWAISSLGPRWTTRILVRPGVPLITDGPYRWLRHPNYLAVVIEIAALPLVHGAWLTAVIFSVANAALLTVRIRAENAALDGGAGG